MRRLLPLMLTAAVLLTACAKPTPLPPPEADKAWEAFTRTYLAPLPATGIRAEASFLFSRKLPEKQSGRLSIDLWGELDGALRMNASAGFGSTVALMREDEGGLLAYYPDRETAYWCEDPVIAAMALGLPLPFSLSDLARLAGGTFHSVVPDRFTIAMVQKDRPTYTFEDGPVSVLQTDSLGRPLRMEGEIRRAGRVIPWRADIDGYDDGPAPERIIFTLENGDRGVLRIRNRELMLTSWEEKALELDLPDKTVIRAVCAFPPAE